MESTVFGQFSRFSETDILPAEQHAYRPGRSIDTATATVASNQEDLKDRKLKRAMSSYDYSAAFDTMDPEAMIFMLEIWVESSDVELFKSYIENAEQMVRFNDAYSSRKPVPFGVRQGSIIGPTLFVVFMSSVYRYCLAGLRNTYMMGYADDNDGLAGDKTYDGLRSTTELLGARLVSFSARNKLVLNPAKTQIMANPQIGQISIGDSIITPSTSLELLGTTFECSGRFSQHNEIVAKDLKKRVGRVRRLSPHLPRGPLLREVGNALVVGKANCVAWVTRKANLPDNPNDTSPHLGQVALNDLARILTGYSRKDRIPVSTLITKARVPTLNEIVVKRAAVEAWKAVNGGALKQALIPVSSSTRHATQGLMKARTNSIPDTNMKRCWNYSTELREARSLNEARKVAKKLGTEARNL